MTSLETRQGSAIHACADLGLAPAPRLPAGQRARNLLSAGAALLLAAAAPALLPHDQLEGAALARQLVDEGTILPLQVLLERARQLHPGVPVAVALEYEAEHGGYVYEIELLDNNGTIWEVELDATDGRKIEIEPAGD